MFDINYQFPSENVSKLIPPPLVSCPALFLEVLSGAL